MSAHAKRVQPTCFPLVVTERLGQSGKLAFHRLSRTHDVLARQACRWRGRGFGRLDLPRLGGGRRFLTCGSRPILQFLKAHVPQAPNEETDLALCFGQFPEDDHGITARWSNYVEH